MSKPVFVPGSPVSSPTEQATHGPRVLERGDSVVVPWRSRWWVRVLAVYAASRVVTTVILLIFARVQGPNPWTAAHPSYFDFASIWDGRWYNIVSIAGYPSSLPTLDGHVTESAWAFLPAYPGLVNAVQFVTGMSWPVAAVLLSALFGAGAALLFYRLLLRVNLSPSTSMFAVVLFCISPVSPLFQLAYAESMYIFLLVAALLLLVERRYGLLFPVVAAMAFTRPSGLAFALALALHVLYRWFTRRTDPFPVRDRIVSLSLTVFSGLAGLAWPAIAGLVTGNLSAYTDSELAWRVPYIGYTQLFPFTSWFQGASWWFTFILQLPAWLGIVALLLVIAVFVAAQFTPAVRRLGVDLRFWIAAYSVYLLAVFFPQSSTFRLLMPLFPLLGAIALPKNRFYRAALIVVFLALQVGWLLVCWGIDGADWSPP